MPSTAVLRPGGAALHPAMGGWGPTAAPVGSARAFVPTARSFRPLPFPLNGGARQEAAGSEPPGPPSGRRPPPHGSTATATVPAALLRCSRFTPHRRLLSPLYSRGDRGSEASGWTGPHRPAPPRARGDGERGAPTTQAEVAPRVTVAAGLFPALVFLLRSQPRLSRPETKSESKDSRDLHKVIYLTEKTYS